MHYVCLGLGNIFIESAISVDNYFSIIFHQFIDESFAWKFCSWNCWWNGTNLFVVLENLLELNIKHLFSLENFYQYEQVSMKRSSNTYERSDADNILWKAIAII